MGRKFIFQSKQSKFFICEVNDRVLGLVRLELAREHLIGNFAKVTLPTCEHCLHGKLRRKNVC